MKKLFKILFSIIVVFSMAYAMNYCFHRKYPDSGLQLRDKNLDWSLKYKNLKGAVDFTWDDMGNYYIAYNSKIQLIQKDGKSFNIVQGTNFKISSIDYKYGKIYYASKDKIYCYNIKRKSNSEFVSGIPNYGDYNSSIVKINGDYIYVSIGSSTNSGVVGMDNKWQKQYPYIHDVTPKDIILKGINFGSGSTGAFQSFGTKSVKGQVIPSHFPGNSSVAVYNLNTGKGSTFAWGIRNIAAMDFNSEGKLLSVVGGMENRGARPISGDNDYIYEIRRGLWYGWPDYSGGDPVTSPKFKGKNNIGFILENHPNMNPPSPMYQYNKVSSLDALAIDISGSIGEKDCIFFYDKTDNLLYSFKYPKAERKEIAFDRKSKINSIKVYGGKLLILDGENGYMYSIGKNTVESKGNLREYNNLYIYLIVLFICAIILILKSRKD